MASKKKVVDIEEVKSDIALVEEGTKEATTNAVESKGDLCTVNNTELSAENNKAESTPRKKFSFKEFLKKNWKKLLIFLGLATAAGAAGYVIGKKSNELTDDDIHDIGQDAIKDYWVRINNIFVDDPDNAYAVSVTNKDTGKVDWLEVTPVDSIPEWVTEDKSLNGEF